MEDPVQRQNIKLQELHTLESIEKDLEDALETDCDTFAAEQNLQTVQAELQNLQLEYDFLTANFGMVKQKLEYYTLLVTDVCDFLKCAPDEVMQVLTGREGEYRRQSLLLDQLEFTERLQESELGRLRPGSSTQEDLLKSVSQLAKKYHKEAEDLDTSLGLLKLNSEKIIRDRWELLE